MPAPPSLVTFQSPAGLDFKTTLQKPVDDITEGFVHIWVHTAKISVGSSTEWLKQQDGL